MDIIIIVKALILGIIEGLTEFLPISSTGHLIVFRSLLNFHGKENVFEISIQLGAVLAVIFEYRRRFFHVIGNLGRDAAVNRFVRNLAIAFVPAAAIGFLFSKHIERLLFNPVSVAVALVAGGFVILWIEKRTVHIPPRVHDVDAMSAKDALIVGLAQVCALIPGTSRSGSTIMGGMWWGLERKTATEFSFFLAVPVMIAATSYKLLKHYQAFSADDFALVAVGFAAAFVSGLLAVKALLKFVSAKNYIPFAYYRILFGGVILFTYLTGWITWS